MAKKTEATSVTIPAIDIKTFALKLVSDSPLIVHAWSEKAKRAMLEKQMKKASAGKAAKDPFRDYCESLYWITDKPENPTPEDVQNARFGFPAIAFKSAAVSGGYRGGVTANKTISRGAFHVMGELIEIEGTPTMREDMVKIAMGTADLRYRGEFKTWAAELQIRYNAGAMSMEQIINLFNVGGFACGIGEWRPERDGQNGMFHVV